MDEEIVLREYLYSLRFYLFFVVILFITAIALGYMGFMSETFRGLFEVLGQLSEDIKDFTQYHPAWLIFLAFFIVIFLNNALTCFLNILTGPLLGIFPLYSLLFNGGLLGWLAHEMGLIVFLLIVPHGMFELPAFFISLAIGLRLARELFKQKEERRLKMKMKNGFRVYLKLIVPLLLIAALIETGLIVTGLLIAP